MSNLPSIMAITLLSYSIRPSFGSPPLSSAPATSMAPPLFFAPITNMATPFSIVPMVGMTPPSSYVAPSFDVMGVSFGNMVKNGSNGGSLPLNHFSIHESLTSTILIVKDVVNQITIYICNGLLCCFNGLWPLQLDCH
jgi:hypothetical protein